MTKITHSSRKLSALLLVGASTLAIAAPAQANDYLFTTQSGPLETGQRITQTENLTQISLNGGGTASFTDNAEYQINSDGSVDLYKGTVTIAGRESSPVTLRMPEGVMAEVSGRNSAANFSVSELGEASGHVLSGAARIGRAGNLRRFVEGAMWSASRGGSPRRVIANGAQSVADTANPDMQIAAIGGDAGPVAAAQNGIPITLGEALAAAGASSDILSAARRVEIAVGNPVIETFPTGDFALLITRAAQIEGAFGGTPFPQAQADIIRAYLRFLADGGSGAQFLSSFSAFSIDYLDLIRAGGVPSGFDSVSANDIDAYLAFINRTGALANIAERDRVLAEAYLSFLRNGGNRDLFAASFTDLTNAYFAFIRAGNAPEDFTGASQAVITQTIAFLSQSGLVEQLSAADQALVAAFLANGGLAFTGQFQTALNEYFAFLASGQLPSTYQPIDQATLRAYLETLSDTGLLASVLGDQAQFYSDYLTFLRAGGDVDGFAGLPVNIFAGYAAQLDAYRAFLAAGNLPSDFNSGDPAQLQAFITELQAAGALERFVGADAAFFAAFAAFVEGGGAFDAFAGLNANIFSTYATQLQAYFTFLEAGGVPSTYEPLSQALIAQYIAELQAAGATARFLPELNDFYLAYFAFITDGGNPDNFAGLPVPPDFGAFAAALNAYADFLANGGLPADFNGEELSVLASFIAALRDAGELNGRLGANADFLTAYFAFIADGGAPNAFAGLPIYADYVAALNAYFAFLQNGGLPSEYGVLSQEVLNAYLTALAAAQGGLSGFAGLDVFFIDFFAFIQGGGNADDFGGLPVNDGRPLNALGDINGWQFARDGLRVARVDAEITDEGRITSLTVYNPSPVTTDYSNRDSDLREFGRIGNDVAWTRYFVGSANGQINVSEHLLVGTPATNIPTTGTVQYNLVGGTAPTNRNDTAGSEAYFTGELGISFGVVPLVGLNFDVLTRTEGYRISTAGGAADPTNGGMGVDGNGRFENQSLGITNLTGTTCTGFCQAQVFGGLFGDGGSSAGFTYNVFDRGAGNAVQGVAIFSGQGDAIDGLGTAPDNGGNSGAPVVGGVDEFDTSVLVAAALSYGEEGFTRTSRTNQTDVSDTGVLNSIGSFGRGTATGDQIIGDEYAIIGRWIDGDIVFPTGARSYTTTANDAAHWAIVSVVDRDFTLSGTIEYDLLGATTPTYSDGRTAPGSFDGSLVINWLSATQIGFNLSGEVTMPDAVYAWSFQRPNFFPRLQGVFESNATIDGVACANNDCEAAVSYQFGGANLGERFAMNYNVSIGTDLDIGGSALFGAPGSFDPENYPGTATNSGGNNPTSGFTGTRNNQVYYTFLDGSLAEAFGGTATFDNGEITQLMSALGTISVNDADIVEAGDLESVAWARWTNGTVLSNGVLGQNSIALGANGGYHLFTGEATTSLPNGTIAYELIGGTSATDSAGSQPGSLTGDLAIAFGSVNRVGYDLSMEVGGRSWAVSTNGGAADPGSSEVGLVSGSAGFTFGGTFNSTSGTVASTGDTCAPSCIVNVSGTLYGDNAAYAALTMNVTEVNSTGSLGASAIGIFGREDNASAAASAVSAVSALTPNKAPIASIDISRWGGADMPTTSSATTGQVPVGLVPPGGITPPDTASVPARTREAAMRQAQRFMGGSITFSNNGGKVQAD